MIPIWANPHEKKKMSNRASCVKMATREERTMARCQVKISSAAEATSDKFTARAGHCYPRKGRPYVRLLFST